MPYELHIDPDGNWYSVDAPDPGVCYNGDTTQESGLFEIVEIDFDTR